jgi:L-fucose isomerase-like protein
MMQGLIQVISAIHDQLVIEKVTGPYHSEFLDLGFDVIGMERILEPDFIWFFIGTGGTEQQVASLCDQRMESCRTEPVFLIAHPGHNSLPASMEILAYLQQMGREGRIYFLNGPDDRAGLDRIMDVSRGLDVLKSLRRSRIGMLGSASEWLIASHPCASTVSEVWGPELVPFAIAELFKAEDNLDQPGLSLTDLVTRSKGILEPLEMDLSKSSIIYSALKQVIDRHELSAITIRCFDLLTEQKSTACLALSKLNDEGIMAGCEGDIPSVLGMLWSHLLTGEIPWMANPVSIEPGDKALWLAHCTAPTRILSRFTIRSHFESGIGAAVQGIIPDQPVTLLRIGGSDLDRLWCCDGHVEGAGFSESLCRTQSRIVLPGDHIQELMQHPLGNHIVMIPGNNSQRFVEWHRMHVRHPVNLT